MSVNLLLDIMEDSWTINSRASCSHMTASMRASCGCERVIPPQVVEGWSRCYGLCGMGVM